MINWDFILKRISPIYYEYPVFYPSYYCLNRSIEPLSKKKQEDIQKKLSEDINKLSLYIEIPWCIKKCPMCLYFKRLFENSSVLERENYIDSVIKEYDLYSEMLINKEIEYIYIGGGSPSLIESEELEKIFEKFNKKFGFSEIKELCFEVYFPESLIKIKDIVNILKKYLKSNQMRISLGVQSFYPQLRNIFRGSKISNSDDIVEIAEYLSLKEIKFNVDIMWGKEGHSVIREIEKLKSNQTLRKADSYTFYQIEPPDDIDGYRYFIEELKIERDQNIIQNERKIIEAELTLLGYKKDLYSNYYSKKRDSITYNKTQMEPNSYYLGLGLKAHGKLPYLSYKNEEEIERYIEIVANKKILPIKYRRILTEDEHLKRKVFLKLRVPDMSFSEAEVEILKKRLNVDDFFYKLKDTFFLKSEAQLYVDEIINFSLGFEGYLVLQHIKRIIIEYLRNKPVFLDYKTTVSILNFILFSLSKILTDILPFNVFFNLGVSGEYFGGFSNIPFGLSKCYRDWKIENKKFNEISTNKKILLFDAIFEKLRKSLDIDKITFSIDGVKIVSLAKNLEKNPSKAKEEFINLFGNYISEEIITELRELNTKEIPEKLYVMNLFEVYVKEVNIKEPEKVNLNFVFNKSLSEYIFGYVIATEKELNGEIFEKFDQVFDIIFSFMAEIQNIKEIKNQIIRTGIISILIDSYAHNIGAHSISALKWWVRLRSLGLEQRWKREKDLACLRPEKVENEKLKEISEASIKNFFDYLGMADNNRFGSSFFSLLDFINYMPLGYEEEFLSFQSKFRKSVYEDENAKENPRFPVPIDHVMWRFLRYLQDKSAFWSGITRSNTFGGEIKSLYSVLWEDFANNPLFLGTIAASEGIFRLLINIQIEDKDGNKTGGEFVEVDLSVLNKKKEKSGDDSLSTVSDHSGQAVPQGGSSYNFVKLREDFKQIKDQLNRLKIFFPGGVVGEQAFFTILENTLRNVKHIDKKDLVKVKTEGDWSYPKK